MHLSGLDWNLNIVLLLLGPYFRLVHMPNCWKWAVSYIYFSIVLSARMISLMLLCLLHACVLRCCALLTKISYLEGRVRPINHRLAQSIIDLAQIIYTYPGKSKGPSAVLLATTEQIESRDWRSCQVTKWYSGHDALAFSGFHEDIFYCVILETYLFFILTEFALFRQNEMGDFCLKTVTRKRWAIYSRRYVERKPREEGAYNL